MGGHVSTPFSRDCLALMTVKRGGQMVVGLDEDGKKGIFLSFRGDAL